MKLLRRLALLPVLFALALLAPGPLGAFTYSTALKNTRMDAITTAIGTSGKLKLYTAGTTTCSGTLLATLALSSTAAPAASGGVLTFSSITSATSGVAAGTAICGTLTTSADAVVVDGISVSTTGAVINMNSNIFSANQTVAVSAFTLTHN